MITSLLIDVDQQSLINLESFITKDFPFLDIQGKASNIEDANNLLNSFIPDLVFLNANIFFAQEIQNLYLLSEPSFDIILLTDSEVISSQTINYSLAGCLTKPIKHQQLNQVISKARKKISKRKENQQGEKFIQNIFHHQEQNDLIGIPTMEGYEFIAVNKIIRCEGLQKCTRIITSTRTDIVSSYNLGEFKKILKPYGFFLIHRSYLINLIHIKKYFKEGTVTMVDNISIPVAKRRKEEFLKRIKKI